MQRACGVVEVFQKSADVLAVGGLHRLAQIRDNPVEVAKHHINCDTEWRRRDVFGATAYCRMDRETDQLPRRAEPAHHHQQGVEENIAMAANGGVEKSQEVLELFATKVAEGGGEARADDAERISCAQDRGELAH